VRHRVQLVKSADMVKNRVHSLLERYGFRPGFSDLFGKAGLDWLKRLELKASYELVAETARLGRLPVVNFAAGGHSFFCLFS